MMKRCASRRRHSVVIVIACAMLAQLGFGCITGDRPAAAQSSGGSTLTLGGELTWDPPWVYNDNASTFDNIRLDHGSHHVLVAVGQMANVELILRPILAQAGGNTNLRRTIDSSVAGDVTTFLDLVVVESRTFGVFALAEPTEGGYSTLTVFMSPIAEFAEGFSGSQAGIAIDGARLFPSVDGDVLQAMLDADLASFEEWAFQFVEVATPVVGVATPDAVEEPAVAPTPVPTEEPLAEPDGDKDRFAGVQPEVPYADQGMVDYRRYVSPQHEAVIEWDQDWELDDDHGQAVVSDADAEVDVVRLLWEQDSSARLTVYVIDSQQAPLRAFVEAGASALSSEAGFEIVLAATNGRMGAIVALIEDGSTDPVLLYIEVRYGPGGDSFVVVELVSSEPSVTEAMIQAAQAGIEVDGEPVLTFYPTEWIAIAHDEGEPPGAVLDRDPGIPGQLLAEMRGRSRPRRSHTPPGHLQPSPRHLPRRKDPVWGALPTRLARLCASSPVAAGLYTACAGREGGHRT